MIYVFSLTLKALNALKILLKSYSQGSVASFGACGAQCCTEPCGRRTRVSYVTCRSEEA